MSRLRSPITWFGGKGNMVAKLVKFLPQHHIYVEAFGGAASLLFAKAPSNVEVYNDRDSRLVNFFRVLRDMEKFSQLERMAMLTPYSREECKAAQRSIGKGNEVEQAWSFFTASRQGFSGNIGSWGYGVSSSSRGMAAQCSKWLGAITALPEVHQRLMQVQIEHDDWRQVLQRYDTPETFFYLDPPYVPSTRKSGSYVHELGESDHQELIETIQGLQGKVLLSGYPNQIYEQLEKKGWQKVEWQTSCHAAGRTRASGLQGVGAVQAKQPRTEAVWFNYEVG